ncbi:3-isopropylmalate dehydratase small subunit [Terricaulis sp.]|uniref:3-isopropylmalate dehydratase small subunit n=1 Tax=Terricaulis sp. TaxID=2768686 RepID=UPI003784CCAC
MPERFTQLISRTVVLPQANIDTDQIIPARFLTTTTRDGLGGAAFYDWRYDANGQPLPDATLNAIDRPNHRILVAGDNFGCGSSREHAPWALMDYGFRAVVSTGIADIFCSNALKNGLLPVVVDTATHARLLDDPGGRVTIDLERCQLSAGNEPPVTFSIDPFARRCLIDGVDTLGWLLERLPLIQSFEARAA